jgi:hypothetical protein
MRALEMFQQCECRSGFSRRLNFRQKRWGAREASGTRDLCVAKNAPLRGSRRFLTAQSTLVRNDIFS